MEKCMMGRRHEGRRDVYKDDWLDVERAGGSRRWRKVWKAEKK